MRWGGDVWGGKAARRIQRPVAAHVYSTITTFVHTLMDMHQACPYLAGFVFLAASVGVSVGAVLSHQSFQKGIVNVM